MTKFEQPVIETTENARQEETKKGMPSVLISSTILAGVALIAFFVIWSVVT